MRTVLIIILAAIALGFGLPALFSTSESAQTHVEYPPSAAQTTNPPAPIDLSGEWVSTESTAGTKFFGHIKNNTILVEMSASDGFSNLWYGTFDFLQPGDKVMVSSAIEGDVFFLSSAETKNFLYQDGNLIFDFSVMGTRTTIEMKRV